MKFSSPPKPRGTSIEAQASDKKAPLRDDVRDRVRKKMELGNRNAPRATEKPTRDQSDDVADIILDFCKNAVSDEPIRNHVLPDLLREVKKCLGGEMWLTLASVPPPENVSLPDLYRITRPPKSSGDYWRGHRATWLATIVKAKAPMSIRETAFGKADGSRHRTQASTHPGRETANQEPAVTVYRTWFFTPKPKVNLILAPST